MLRAFSDRTRLRIVSMLRPGELCVCDIVVVLGVPQLKASRHLAYGKLANGAPKSPRSQGEAKDSSTPVGMAICFGIMLLGLIFAIICVVEVVDKKSLTSVAATCGLCAVGCIVVAFAGLANVCPNCHKLFTSETLNSESLGSHVEIRREQRVARHYNPSGGGIQGETHYEADVPVHVQRFKETKRCKTCGHVWETMVRTET